MYCPICHSEYRSGFTRCQECDQVLVTELPKDEPIIPVKFKELGTNLWPDQISVIKSLLESNDIKYLIQGEGFASVMRASNFTRLLVDENEIDRAEEILKDFM
jgi:hypothetical protein